jgi:hypothetical protein
MTVPSKDRGDLIREHGERLATLDERIENIRREIDDNIRRDIERVQRSVEADINRIQQSLEAQKERRWSMNLALVGLLGAIVGGMLTEAFKLLASRLLK